MKYWLTIFILMESINWTNPFFSLSLIRRNVCANRLNTFNGFNGINRFNRFNSRFNVFPRLPNGVREGVLAVNAYCDDFCTGGVQQQMVINCIQAGLGRGSLFIQILQNCAGGDIQCGRNQINRLNRCIIRRSVNRRNLVGPRLQRCFRQSLSLATIDCLIRRYRILRVLLPIPRGPTGPLVTQFLPQKPPKPLKLQNQTKVLKNPISKQFKKNRTKS